MSHEQLPKTTGLKVRSFDTDAVFAMLNDPVRRRIILSLANGGMKTAEDIGAGTGMRRPTYLKQLRVLCEAGLLVKKENPDHGRKPLFGLAAAVVVCKSDDCMTVDFGRGMLRVPRTAKAMAA